MQISQIFIFTGGLLHLCMGIFHTRFYSMFGWKDVFGKIDKSQQRIFYTIHQALLLLFFLTGILSIIFSGELAKASGSVLPILIAFVLFWLWRGVWQLAYFKIPKSKRFHQFRKRHYFLTLCFFLLALAYLGPVVFSIVK